MSKLEMLKTELQGLVDKGKITAKEYQDKIDSAIYQDGGYEGKGNGMKQKHIILALGGLIIGFLIGKKIK
jgi:hypothetical protein|tara:strand:- start:1134 stop:1343 length:210 start_codon:yes stop_codon:yes gene_type:complete